MPNSDNDEAADEHLPKNYQDFPDGSLLRVIFHNFLTYEHTSFVPTASLNMILGHNGSGKSSIICGICLACGGSPKSLGRSEKIQEYVRHGCQEGYVEIAIADQKEGPQTVRLTIRAGKAPEYRLNNQVTTQAELKLTIWAWPLPSGVFPGAIDNPCAFLAQDKVKSFSEQSAIELLRNTEKAASEDLSVEHEALMEQRHDSTTIEDKCATSEKAVKNLENEIHKLEPFVENYRKKLALQTKLRLLEKKMKILEFEKAEKEFGVECENARAATQEYDQMLIEEKTTVVRTLRQSAEELMKRMDDTVDKRSMEIRMESAIEKMESIKKAFKRHDRDMAKAQETLEATQEKHRQALEDMEGFEEWNEKFKLTEARLNNIEADFRRKQDKIREESYQHEARVRKEREAISDANSILRDRIRVLQGLDGNAYKAYEYYMKNRPQFDADIYVPIIDITLKTPTAAKILENSVGMRDRTMFVCQTKADEQRMHANNGINTTVLPPEKVHREDIEARSPPAMKRIGFEMLAAECFDAPDPLKQFLINVSGLGRILVGNQQVDRNMEAVSRAVENTPYGVFLTPTMRCQVSKSKYSGQSSHMQTLLRDAYTFRDPCYRKAPQAKRNVQQQQQAMEQLRQAEQMMQQKQAQLREKIQAVQRERDVVRNECSEWRSKRHLVGTWQADVKLAEENLKRLEEQNIDVDAAEQEFEETRANAIEQTLDMFRKAVKWQKAYLENYEEVGRHTFIEMICKNKVRMMKLEEEDLRKKLNELSHTKREAEANVKSALNRKRAAAEAMSKTCQLKHLKEKDMDAAEKRIFEKLSKLFEEGGVPENLDALELEISSEQARLRLAEDQGEDGGIEHEHQMEKLKLDFVEEQSRHEKLVENRRVLHEELGTNIENWREKVEEMIDHINENYVKYFGELGCRGEVGLETPENLLDIAKYGIMISVSFRAGEKMKRLDNKVQSGGERSVATMLYLLALQQLCPVPFRCIDEINQGMDPTNERKVFDIMVGLWNGSQGALTKTQYFLLSPKLLHGLDMRENVNVVMVNSTLTTSHGEIYDTESKLAASLSRLQTRA
ncbi:unnamed protein product [Caenorhabditis sp. 36 PRJEB53466]|nr:unnamed protein product [Caenorhabditis sp. 36 PRJEB53466]